MPKYGSAQDGADTPKGNVQVVGADASNWMRELVKVILRSAVKNRPSAIKRGHNVWFKEIGEGRLAGWRYILQSKKIAIARFARCLLGQKL